MTRVFITGSAGFIGFHLARRLAREGWEVHGFDAITDHYDVALKRRRHALLRVGGRFTATEARLEDAAALTEAVAAAAPEVIVHLAAQAGVRYSLENPQAYVAANIQGSFNLLEAAARARPRHLLIASTSSVYGGNPQLPFAEADPTDLPLTIYAASKRAAEALSHAQAHLHDLPTTLFRFFTVYGPWGRPDMALFKFTRAILEGRPIDIYGHGEMRRDFTYIDDLVRAVRLLIDVAPRRPGQGDGPAPGDSLSPVAPWRTVNIGNARTVRLLDFVEALEAALGRRAIRNMLGAQPGEVPATWADAALLERLTGYRPQTDYREGIARFVGWYRSFYGV